MGELDPFEVRAIQVKKFPEIRYRVEVLREDRVVRHSIGVVLGEWIKGELVYEGRTKDVISKAAITTVYRVREGAGGSIEAAVREIVHYTDIASVGEPPIGADARITVVAWEERGTA